MFDHLRLDHYCSALDELAAPLTDYRTIKIKDYLRPKAGMPIVSICCRCPAIGLA